MSLKIPSPDANIGLRALQAMIREGHILAAMQVFHAELGDIFRVTLPGFRPVFMAGPEACRFVLVSARGDLRWRAEGDPVVRLLRHGLLVEDGETHDTLRRQISPALHKKMLEGYIDSMWRCTQQVSDAWPTSHPVDMLVEMRRIALLILMENLYRVDFTPELQRLWKAILRTIEYISPGLWMIWGGIPRIGYSRALRQMDAYLYRIIRMRRSAVGTADDLLGLLITAPEMSDDLIRDQLLTILIAGHDTSTALLSWALYLLGKHPEAMERARAEIDAVLGTGPLELSHISQLTYLGQVLNEALRLYPPIHLGSRVSATDLEFHGYYIPAGTRVVYSIYLTHRHPDYWPEPDRFNPERFAPDFRPAPYTFLPFGGGPRNCIGAAFAQVEVKVVLAQILQNFDLKLVGKSVHPHMGATLEPRPGVLMLARRRRGN
jgi:cytochrome P450